jgi:hypothetical protein
MDLYIEMSGLIQWFRDVYDVQVSQYMRCQRTGEVYDGDMSGLDAEASAKQLRIREIRKIVGEIGT